MAILKLKCRLSQFRVLSERFPNCGWRSPEGSPEHFEGIAGTPQKPHILILILNRSLLLRNLQLTIMLIVVLVIQMMLVEQDPLLDMPNKLGDKNLPSTKT